MNNWFAAAAAGVLAMFGASGGDMPRPDMQHNPSTTRPKMEEKMFKHASSTGATIDVACVSAAVATREASLGSAESTFTTAINAAYSTRGSALASAYTQSGNDAIKSAVKTAWKNFADATKGAKRAWQKARENSWATFRTAVKSCGNGASSITDSGNAGSEMSGQ